jgi:iron complex transport system substrate-binding protein
VTSRLTCRLNAALLVAALALAGFLARNPGGEPLLSVTKMPEARARNAPVTLPDGGLALRDANRHLCRLRDFRRIVSTSLLTDRLLVALGEPDRVLAFSRAGADTPWAYQYAGKPTVEGLGALEPLIALHPDLVLMNSFGASGRVAKVRDAGIEVFDFGEMRGLATLGASAEDLATLLGHPERGVRFAQSLTRRMNAVAAGLGARRRWKALYLASFGNSLYGGTIGTSYHDVLVAAGLQDVAAERFRDWPSYSSEQLIALAPERLVTKDGMGALICRHPGLEGLPACRRPEWVIELPAALIDEPGPAMLDAAELLFEKAYGR